MAAGAPNRWPAPTAGVTLPLLMLPRRRMTVSVPWPVAVEVAAMVVRVEMANSVVEVVTVAAIADVATVRIEAEAVVVTVAVAKAENSEVAVAAHEEVLQLRLQALRESLGWKLRQHLQCFVSLHLFEASNYFRVGRHNMTCVQASA